MRLALISDLHGNLTALEAVIERLPDENLDGIVGLGDISSNGPSPRECLARVRELGCPVILGNAGEALLERREYQAADDCQRIIIDQTLWAREQLTGEDREVIAGFLPTHRVVLGPDHGLLCSHGSPAPTARSWPRPRPTRSSTWPWPDSTRPCSPAVTPTSRSCAGLAR